MASTPTKCRSVLSRTLVLVLNPLSDVCQSSTGSPHRLTSKKIESVFRDFQKCNKHSISVPLRDAIDDINLVGWLAPHTLLIHGTSEDMDTIQQAWVGRMLKPPQNYHIKHFCEIPSLDIKQIPQSQFISICDTLLQIISTLNESQIRATLECIMIRLNSNFDSIIMPPISAVKRSLDLLVKETELDVVEGSYYVRAPRDTAAAIPRNAAHGELGKDPSVLSFDDVKINADVHQRAKNKNIDGYYKQTIKCHRHSGKNIPLEEWGQNKDKVVGQGKYTNRKHAMKKKKNKSYKMKTKKGKPSSKKMNMQMSGRRNNSYSKLSNSDSIDSETVQCRNRLLDKRSTIFGKLSRLFRKASCDEGDVTKRECEHEEWRESWSDNSDNKRHLVRHNKQKQIRRDFGDSRNFGKAASKTTNVKQKGKRYKNALKAAKFTTRCNKENRHNLPSSGLNFPPYPSFDPKRKPPCSSEFSSKASRDRISPASKEKHGVYKREETTSDFSSSCSESSFYTEPCISDSYSSGTCADVLEQPFHYPSIDAAKKLAEKSRENSNLNSCSTQAICGDLEGSSPSLISSQELTPDHLSSAREELKENIPANQGDTTPSQNILQLIGVL